MKRVLAIDGGGIRGIIPAIVCSKFEEWGNIQTHQLFDLIAGTSTGGILTLGMAQPPQGLRAAELVSFYKTVGPKIFSSPRGKVAASFGPKYSNKALVSAAAEMFGMNRLADAVVEVMVVAYDTQLRRPVYLRRSAAQTKPQENWPMKDIAVATSSAPTYFPPYKLGDHLLIDGGVVANNPACAAYAHAKSLWPDEEILMVSLGTGSSAVPLPRAIEDWGTLDWVKPLIDCLFDGTSLAVEDFFRHTQLPHYTRFQTALNERTSSLDAVSAGSMAALEQLGTNLAIQNEGAIFALLSQLKQAGQVLSAQVNTPRNGELVKLGPLEVSGTVDNYNDEVLYLFTGKLGRYWPSSRVKVQNGRFVGGVNVGKSATEATISLVKVDRQLEQYIEYYRASAEKMGHCGIELSPFKKPLAQIEVRLDHRPT